MTVDRFQHSPWSFWDEADAAAHAAQRSAQQELLDAHPGWSFGQRCFVSDLASVDADELVLGDGTYLAAGAYVTGTVRLGRDVSVNPSTTVRGDVVIGDATRIGAHTSILGFNHTMDDPDTEIRLQPLSFAASTSATTSGSARTSSCSTASRSGRGPCSRPARS